MRQGQSQQNRNRSRGRNQGNRNKGGNQTNRNMESNGPDVRIRGTASHIAEKYTTLARDAHSSGDLVVAENYYQHAEHYNRMIATAQAAQAAQIAKRETNRNEDTRRRFGSAESDENQSVGSDIPPSSEIPSEGDVSDEPIVGSGPQPVFDEIPAEVAIKQSAVNGSTENSEAKASEAPRRPRRAARRPRKEATPAADKKKAETPAEQSSDLPAFIVGANDS